VIALAASLAYIAMASTRWGGRRAARPVVVRDGDNGDPLANAVVFVP
jgi:hypothetical protein